jgi:hypothetical protein
MAEDGKPDAISLEAHERVQQENASLKEQLAGATTALTDLQRVDNAYQHFRSVDGIKDPYGLARSAGNDVLVRGADPDSLPGALDQWLSNQSAMFASPAPPAGDDEAAEPVTPAAPETPAIAGPNPAADGKIPKGEPMSKEEFDSLDFAGKKAAMREGKFVLKGEHYKRLVDDGAVAPS